MNVNIGQLVKIIYARDQPPWIRNIIDKIGLIVDKYSFTVSYSSTRYKVLIEEKIYDVHPLDLEPLNDHDTQQ